MIVTMTGVQNRRPITRRFWLKYFLPALGLCGALHSQTAGLKANLANTPVPTVSFTFEFAGGDPSYFAIAVESTGAASYRSTGASPVEIPDAAAASEPATGAPYFYKFNISEAMRTRIFQLAEHTHYFEGNFEYKHRLADTGTKTLAYTDPNKKNQTTYNYSTNAAIQELTHIFQGMSVTLEAGRRLEYLYQHQKLGLDEEIKRMDELSKDNQFEELQTVAPTLKKIANDPSVLNIVRERARHLLQVAGQPPGR
jgi:hypothetical protein